MRISRKNFAAGLLLCLPVLVPVAIFYARPRRANEIKLYSDAKLVKSEVARQIPIGSDIHSAKRILQSNGLGCSVVINGTVANNFSLEQAEKSGQKTALSCTKSTKFLFTKIWMVDLNYRKSKVSDISVFFRSTASDF